MSVSERYPARQFVGARAALGLYLAAFFLWLAPYAGDLYGSEGIYRRTPDTPFPNLLDALSGHPGPLVFALVLGVLSLGFAVGIARRPLAVAIWYGYACLFERLIYVSIPQAPFVGWMLLATCLVPTGEPAVGRSEDRSWRMPSVFLVAAWTVLAVAYFASGVSKLASPSFVDGSALSQIFASPIGRRGGPADTLRACPEVLALLTWGSLALELLFAPMCLWGPTRAVAWFSMSAMHVGIVLTLGIADVPLGMLVVHAFVFDVGWVRRFRRAERDPAPPQDARASGA